MQGILVSWALLRGDYLQNFLKIDKKIYKYTNLKVLTQLYCNSNVRNSSFCGDYRTRVFEKSHLLLYAFFSPNRAAHLVSHEFPICPHFYLFLR